MTAANNNKKQKLRTQTKEDDVVCRIGHSLTVSAKCYPSPVAAMAISKIVPLRIFSKPTKKKTEK